MNFFYHQLTELYLTLCSFRFSREFHHVFTSGLEFNVIDIVGNIQILENVFYETLQSVIKNSCYSDKVVLKKFSRIWDVLLFVL